MARKRNPGGGRKSKGEFSQLTSSLTIRMPDDMRRRLESEAAEKDESVSQVLLWHLQRSFNREKDLERDPAIRAYCFLIAEMADRITWASAATDDDAWERNPFLFQAFRAGVAELLGHLAPKGEVKRLPVEEYMKKNRVSDAMTDAFIEMIAKPWESPESAARNAVNMTMFDFASPSSPDAAERLWQDNLGAVPDKLRKKKERTWYGMADVRRDLGLQSVTMHKAGGEPKS